MRNPHIVSDFGNIRIYSFVEYNGCLDEYPNLKLAITDASEF